MRTRSAQEAFAIVATFAARLPLRPDRDAVLAIIAREFARRSPSVAPWYREPPPAWLLRATNMALAKLVDDGDAAMVARVPWLPELLMTLESSDGR